MKLHVRPVSGKVVVSCAPSKWPPSPELMALWNREALAKAGCPCGSKAHSACSKAGLDLDALDVDDDPCPPDAGAGRT